MCLIGVNQENMNSGEDDSPSFENERDDEFQEKLDFEENDIISDDNANDSNQKHLSLISLSSENGASLIDDEEVESIDDKPDEKQDDKLNSKQIVPCKSTIIKLTSSIRNGEDGELRDDTDEDLEEGELKDDDEDNNPLNQSLDVLINKSEQKKMPCKFYSNGFCTWGDQCRFLHSGIPSTSSNYKSTSTNQQSSYQRTNTSSRNYQKPQYARPYSNEFESQIDDADSKYESYDTYDTRTNYKDYERKRRLALESAPWNDEYFERHSRTDSYRDKNELNTRNVQPSTNHSNSSSFSDFTDSEKSFKQREPSPVQRKRKYSGHTLSPNHPHHSLSKRGREEDSSPNSSLFSDSADEFERKAPYRRKSLSLKRRRSRSRERLSSERLLREKLRMDRVAENSTRLKHRERRSVERVEKKPIKMTFMRKQVNLSKGEFHCEEDELDDEFDLYGGKDTAVSTKVTKTSEKSSGKATGTSRDDLLKRLKEIDEAIAKKRSRS